LIFVEQFKNRVSLIFGQTSQLVSESEEMRLDLCVF